MTDTPGLSPEAVKFVEKWAGQSPPFEDCLANGHESAMITLRYYMAVELSALLLAARREGAEQMRASVVAKCTVRMAFNLRDEIRALPLPGEPQKEVGSNG